MINDIEPAYIPKRATKGSAGYDIALPHDVILYPGVWTTIDTGVKFTNSDKCFAENKWVALVFPRSSLGFKYGMCFANTVGVIDQDYRDTIKLCVSVDTQVILEKGERIAQMIFVPYTTLENEVKPTQVRCGGIGSTGKQFDLEDYQ